MQAFLCLHVNYIITMMNYNIFASLLLVSPFLQASLKAVDAPSIIPLPQALELATPEGALSFSGKFSINPQSDKDLLPSLTDSLAAEKLDIDAQLSKDNILLLKDATLAKDAYQLNVSAKGVEIRSNSASGVFYAIKTLKQSIIKDAQGKKLIPWMQVKDAPRFAWRGLMVDSGRNAYSVAEMKKIVDLMAHYKLNTLHWHLTDDQGWRIEIKKYPKLTSIGSKRAETPILGDRTKGDGKPYEAFFTQEEIKDVVAYAKAKHITVVPEIELPGHAAAAITAYPELGNTDIPNYKPEVKTSWGVHEYIFNPSDKTFEFLNDVLTEVCMLFPDSPYIHVGGDEAPKDQWEKSPFAQEFMKAKGIPNEHALQSYFIKRVEDMIVAKGKKLIGWDEIQEGGLSKTATMMVWRDWKWAKHAVENGNDIVMTPNSHCYLDYKAGVAPNKAEFDMIGGDLPLEKVYSLNPVPADFTEEQAKKVIGVQGNCWSEYTQTHPKWEYMTFPRAIALAEVAWTPQSRKNEASFKLRLKDHKQQLDEMKVNYRQDDGSPAQPSAPVARP